MVLSITPLVTGADRLAELAGVDVIRGSVRPRVGVDLSVGANAMAPSGPLHGLRAAVEVGVPVYQRLDGPQLETDLVLTVGAQYAFHL